MYALRILLSYSLLIVIVAASAFAYLNRDRIIPEAKATYEEYRTMLIATVEKLPSLKDSVEQQPDSSMPVEKESSMAMLDQAVKNQDSDSNATGTDVTSNVAIVEQEQEIVKQETVEQEKIAEPMIESTKDQPEKANETDVEPVLAHVSTGHESNEVVATEEITEEVVIENTTAEPSVANEALLETPDVEETTTAVVTQTPEMLVSETPVSKKSTAEPEAEKNSVMPEDESKSAPAKIANQDIAVTTVVAEPENDRISEIPTVETELLARARSAYWRGQLDEAVNVYEKLVATNPADPNAYGELGNVYYTMGKWEKAGDAYYEAARRLIDRGQTGQLDYLLRVLQGLNEQKAKDIAKQLNG